MKFSEYYHLYKAEMTSSSLAVKRYSNIAPNCHHTKNKKAMSKPHKHPHY